jgi:hypothetical protein
MPYLGPFCKGVTIEQSENGDSGAILKRMRLGIVYPKVLLQLKPERQDIMLKRECFLNVKGTMCERA